MSVSEEFVRVPVLDRPNVYRMVDPRKGGDSNPTIQGTLKPVVEELASKYLTWEFAFVKFNMVKVFCKGEFLGLIHSDYSGYQPLFRISNDRIGAKLNAATGMRTKDPAKLMKLVKKYFYPKTLDETMSDIYSKTCGTLERTGGKARLDLDSTVRKHTDLWIGLALGYTDAVRDFALERGEDVSFLDTIRDKSNTLSITEGLQACVRGSKGVVVLIRGREYVVATLRSMPPYDSKIYTTDTLPEHIKQSVGLLKLVDAGEVLRGVGMRVEASVFIVEVQREEA
jgi:hypothetical protein